MKKFQLSLLALAIATAPAFARQLAPAEALAAATDSHSGASAKLKAATKSGMKLAYTVEDGDFNSCYIFNRGNNGGFVVVAADDAVTPLLGYSDSGSFDPANIPANMKAYLEGLTAEIRFASENPEAVRKTNAVNERAAIAPICTTKWSQDDPYNLACPVMNGSRAVTGCVATAMAQIMKAHNWPVKGVGTKEYSWKYNNSTYSTTCKFSEHTYDWDNMLDTYTSSQPGTDAERKAVAQLMYDCGAGVEMNYSPIASGATSLNAAIAFVTYFDYDKDLRHVYRSSYYRNEWNDLAYAELAAGRPTLICGANTEGGHAFVCDGYSENDFFHINWGWSGMSDGYFLLTALDPTSQGIGGSNDGYNTSQTMIVGIQRPTGDKEFAYSFLNQGGFTATDVENRNDKVTFSTVNGGAIYNICLSKQDISGTIGVKLVNTANGEVTYIGDDSKNVSEMPFTNGISSYTVAAAKFPTSGEYVVTPAFRSTSGKWTDIKVDITASAPLHCVATENSLTFSAAEEGETKITEFSVIGDTYLGYPLIYKWKLESSKPEVFGYISTAICSRVASGYRKIDASSESYYDIVSGETIEETWTTAFDESKLSARSYYLVFYLNSEIIGEFPITMKANPGELAYDFPTFVSLDPKGEVTLGRRTRPATISPDHDLEARIAITSGYLGDNITIDIYSSTGFIVARSEAQNLCAASGETLTIKADHSIFNKLMPDVLYYAVIQPANGKRIPEKLSANNPIWFKLSESAGVEDVAADNNDAPVEYFNLQGIRVDKPEAGSVVIRRQGSEVSKIIAR